MGIISVLSKQLANLIAAGEVVERPASVVKELCENSLDAGADTITVEIKGGGALFIRVSDNGCGMAQDDAVLAFSRHATSKLSKEEQLAGISTMGFRGEALAAISSVSKVELLTRQKDSEEGVLVTADGGEVSQAEAVGCPVGTTIIIRDLFFNTPARLKFLKKDNTEAAAIESFVQKLAVARSDVAFELIRDGKSVLLTDGNGMKSAVYDVFGEALADDMMTVDYEYEGVTVKGYVGRPEISRPSRKLQFFSVNGRVIRSLVFQRAVEEALKNSLMQGKYPICALDVSVSFNGVDVNVHPSKLEIKFADERKMYDAVYFAVKNTFFEDTKRPVFKLPETKAYTRFEGDFEAPLQTELHASTPDYSEWSYTKTEPAVKERDVTDAFAKQMEKLKAQVEETKKERTVQEAQPVKETVKENKEIKKIPDFIFVGEVFKTYVIVEVEDEVLVIDKHAAKERMLFEKLKSIQGTKHSQTLLSPTALYLSKEEKNAVIENMPFFSSMGFEIEDFGDDSLIMRGVPSDINAPDAEAMVVEAAGKLLEGRRDATPDIYDEIMHSMACKAALKGGQRNAQGDLKALVAELLALPDIKHCPHGRPVMMSMTRSYFESRFKR